MNLLFKNAGKNNVNFVKKIKTNPLNNIVLFVDCDVEKIKDDKHPLESVNKAFSRDLYNLVKQKTCPVIIFGTHLLKNALKLSCSLNDWHVIEFSRDGVEGYILVPKHIVAEYFNSNNPIETIFRTLNFSMSKITCNYVDEIDVLNKKDNIKKAKENDFSFNIPLIIKYLLLPAKRFVYWGGHGSVRYDYIVGGLFNNDAENLLMILEDKDTKLIYISSCYFGGMNFEITKNIFDMAIVSSATTEISTVRRSSDRISNWNAFFNMLSEADSRFSRNSDYYKYLANKVYPFIVSFDPDISNFPHIKLPGEKLFKLLPINDRAILIDDEMLLNYSKSRHFIDVKDKRLLEINSLLSVKPIQIKNTIPLIVSNNYKNMFEQIYIDSLKENKTNNFNLIIEKMINPSLFDGSTIENVFYIKKLKTKDTFNIYIKENEIDKKVELPNILYNVFIHRGPDNTSDVFFETKDKIFFHMSYDYKLDKWISNTQLSYKELCLYQDLIDLYN